MLCLLHNSGHLCPLGVCMCKWEHLDLDGRGYKNRVTLGEGHPRGKGNWRDCFFSGYFPLFTIKSPETIMPRALTFFFSCYNRWWTYPDWSGCKKAFHGENFQLISQELSVYYMYIYIFVYVISYIYTLYIHTYIHTFFICICAISLWHMPEFLTLAGWSRGELHTFVFSCEKNSIIVPFSILKISFYLWF